jgi:hypothetical protein
MQAEQRLQKKIADVRIRFILNVNFEFAPMHFSGCGVETASSRGYRSSESSTICSEDANTFCRPHIFYSSWVVSVPTRRWAVYSSAKF